MNNSNKNTITLITAIAILITSWFIFGYWFANYKYNNPENLFSSSIDTQSTETSNTTEISSEKRETTKINTTTKQNKETKTITEKTTVKNTEATTENVNTKVSEKNTTEKVKTVNDINTSFNDNAFSKAMFNLVNDYRSKHGLSKLTYSKDLEAIACVRTKEASENWAHTRPDGRSYSTIFTEYNYKATFVGENLANGSNNPEKLFEAWLNSPTHKENIIHSRFTKTGIAIFCTADGEYYIAESFSN